MKLKKVITTSALALAMACMIGQVTNVQAATPKSPTSISVTNAKSNKLTVYVGKTTTLKTTLKPSNLNKKYKALTFKTSNKKIATVTSKGVVKGVKVGSAKITITSKANKKVKKVIAVTVKKPSVTIKAKTSSASLYVGNSTTLGYTLTAKGTTNKGVTFTSSNKSVATVTSKGVVKGLKTGTATITMTSKFDKTKKATVKVTVTKKVAEKIVISYNTGYCRGDKVKLKKSSKLDYSAEDGACYLTYTYNGNDELEFISSNKNVATVNSKGVISILREGKFKLTIRSKKNSKVTASKWIETSINSDNYADYMIGNEDLDWWDTGLYPGAKSKPFIEVRTEMVQYNFLNYIGRSIKLKQVYKKEELGFYDETIHYYLELSPRAKAMGGLDDVSFVLGEGNYITVKDKTITLKKKGFSVVSLVENDKYNLSLNGMAIGGGLYIGIE